MKTEQIMKLFVQCGPSLSVGQTLDGELINVQNEGIIDVREPQNMKTTPRFQVSLDSKYEWLNYGSYTGTLTNGSLEGEVVITIEKLVEELR